MTKKGQNFNTLTNFVLAVVILGVISVVGLLIVDGLKNDLTANTTAYNATEDVETGIAAVPEKIPLLATIVVLLFILVFVIRSLQGTSGAF